MKNFLLVTTLVSSAVLAAEAPGPDLSACVDDHQVSVLFVLGFEAHALDYACAADAYQAAGMYEMAARMRCKIDEVRYRFYEIEDCVQANISIPAPEEPVAPGSDWSSIQAESRGNAEEIQALQQQVGELQRDLAAERAEQPPAPPPQIVIQQEYLSESKRDKLRALKEEQ